MHKWYVALELTKGVEIVADKVHVNEDGTLEFWRTTASNPWECLLKAFTNWQEVTLLEE